MLDTHCLELGHSHLLLLRHLLHLLLLRHLLHLLHLIILLHILLLFGHLSILLLEEGVVLCLRHRLLLVERHLLNGRLLLVEPVVDIGSAPIESGVLLGGTRSGLTGVTVDSLGDGVDVAVGVGVPYLDTVLWLVLLDHGLGEAGIGDGEFGGPGGYVGGVHSHRVDGLHG